MEPGPRRLPRRVVRSRRGGRLSWAFTCLGQDPPVTTETPGEALPEGLHPPDPVELPYAIDGESPVGIRVCALAVAGSGCTVYAHDTGRDQRDVPHDGTVVAVGLTVTYSPATPETRGISLGLVPGDQSDWPLLGPVDGPSGTTLSLQGLNVSVGTRLTLVGWNMPDANVQGPVRFDRVAQPYHVEGEVVVRPSA